MNPDKPLTRREWEVLELLLQGRSNKQIALALDISIRTVEFHLKNIYAKHEVASRVELILKLGQTTVPAKIEKPVDSTVAGSLQSVENGDRPAPLRVQAASFRNALSMSGRETDMKQPFTKYTVVGVSAALLAGILWILLLRNAGNMSIAEIKLWIAPMLLVWVAIGAAAGWAGKRFGGSLLRVAASSLAATGLSPIGVLPLMGFVVLPFAKLLERTGLFDASSMPRETASLLAIIAMLILWLVLGAAAASLLSVLAVKRPAREFPSTPAQ